MSNNNNTRKNNNNARNNASQKKKKVRSAASLARRAEKWASQKAEKKASAVTATQTKRNALKAEEERKQQSVLAMFPDVMGLVGAQGFMSNVKKVSVVSKSLAANLKATPLFQAADRATIYPNGQTLLNKYLGERNWDKANEILDQGVPKRILEYPLLNGEIPLYYVFLAGKFDLFKKILDNKVDPNVTHSISTGYGAQRKYYTQSILNRIALEYIRIRDKENYIDELLKHGADINARDSKGFTVLENLMKFNRVSEAIYFIEKGVALETPNKNGFTPVLTAIGSINLDILEKMKAKGVDFNKKTGDGNLFPLKTAVLNGKYFVLDWMLKNTDVDLNMKDEEGNTAMHYAVLTKNFNKIALLKGMGADSKIPNKKGATALQMAQALATAGDNKALDILKQ
jgi:hypothetical protein